MDRLRQQLQTSDDAQSTKAIWAEAAKAYDQKLQEDPTHSPNIMTLPTHSVGGLRTSLVAPQSMSQTSGRPEASSPMGSRGFVIPPPSSQKRPSLSPEKESNKSRKHSEHDSPEKGSTGNRRRLKQPQETDQARRGGAGSAISPQTTGHGRSLWFDADSTLPTPDFSMVKLLDYKATDGDGSVNPQYLSIDTLPPGQQASLRQWWTYLVTQVDAENFERWWNGLGAKTSCLGCKVKSKTETTWNGSFACKTCASTRAQRPCFRMMDIKREDGTIVREIQVLPDNKGSFDYWSPVKGM